MTDPLPFRLERRVHIRAAPDTVFRYFLDSRRFAAWWGAGSSIDARPGGAVRIVYPNGVTASGEVVEVVASERIVFTYGYDDPGKPIAPGGSRVTITLAADARGTLVCLTHAVADESTRDMHAPGWSYQLALFANVVAAEQHADVAGVLDRFFAVWSEGDAATRDRELASLASDDVTYRDRFACVVGRAELVGHIGAAQMHSPGGTVERDGDPRQCQGAVLVDWLARAPDGSEFARGTNVFELTGDGRIDGVVAFWAG